MPKVSQNRYYEGSRRKGNEPRPAARFGVFLDGIFIKTDYYKPFSEFFTLNGGDSKVPTGFGLIANPSKSSIWFGVDTEL